MSYREELGALADATQIRVTAGYDSLPAADFPPVAAAVVAVANLRATATADLAMAVHLDRLPLGLGRPDELERLEGAVNAVLQRVDASTVDDPRPRLARLASNEPLDAAAGAAGRALTVAGVGWRRHLSVDPCPRCVAWAGDGAVFAPDARFERHPGCTCIAVPTATEGEP